MMIKHYLSQYKASFENSLTEALAFFGAPSVLKEAIAYALKNGGKRFRPAIVSMVADALGSRSSAVDSAALAIEYFHTASLIADDLPCMDDDVLRRELPTLHKIYGEATAILASYALISAGYDQIRIAAQSFGNSDLALLAIENASYNTGIFGAAGGQHSDLFPGELTERELLIIIDKKTGTLFEISFVFGWLFGGGAIEKLETVKKAAGSFGRAFQISDDLLDFEQDEDNLNFARTAGLNRALTLLEEELKNYYGALKLLDIKTPTLLALGQLIEERINAFTSQ